MKLLEHYLLSCIDRALDDGKPLTGWTGRLIRRNERLRRYYEFLLALELELRFSDDVSSAEPTIALLKKTPPPFQKIRHPFVMGATVAVLLLVAIGLFFREAPPTQPPLPPPEIVDAPSIDDVFLELVSAVPWKETPTEAIVDFSERPLEWTSMLLAQVGSVVAKHSPE